MKRVVIEELVQELEPKAKYIKQKSDAIDYEIYEHNKKIDELELQITGLKEKIAKLSEEAKELYNDTCYKILEVLRLLEEERYKVYPDNNETIKVFEKLKTIEFFDAEKHSTLENWVEKVVDIKDLKDLSPTSILKLLELIQKYVFIETKKAAFHLNGRVKGYKGDETTFKPSATPIELVDNPKGLEIEYDSDWEYYYDKEIDPKNIDWPDHKSTMAYATIYADVKVVYLKDLKDPED